MNSIETTRFGKVAVTDEHVIRFEDGIIGFPSLKEYVLIESPAMPLVLWLQAVGNPEIAFPVAEPWFFKRDYKIVMNDADKHTLRFSEGDPLKTFLILTIPEDMNRMTVNMRAPIILNINQSTGTQAVLQDKTLEVRTPAHESFTKALSQLTLTQSAVDFDDDADQVWSPVNVRGAGAEAK